VTGVGRRFTVLLIIALGGATLDAACARPMAAQTGVRATLAMADALPRAGRAARAGVPSAPVLTIAAVPSSFQVVGVDVPKEFPATSEVRWEVEATGDVELLSPRQGRVRPGSGTRRALLTIRVARGATAGRHALARVRFRLDGLEIVRAVEVDVARVAGVTMTADRDSRAARAGERFALEYRVRNSGNAPDTLTLHAQATAGWVADVIGAPRVVLAADETHVVRVQVRVPSRLAAGTGEATLVADGAAVERARLSTRIDVVELGHTTRDETRILASLANVTTQHGDVAPVLQVGVRGMIGADTRIDAQVSSLRASDPVMLRSASALGLMSGNDALRLSHPRWDLTLGATGARTSALTAQFLGATGGSLTLRADDTHLQLLLGRPFTAHTQARPSAPVWGAMADWQRAGVSWTARAVRMDDGGITDRALSAVSMGADFAPFAGAHLSTELAGRRFTGGSGLGASTELRMQSDASLLAVRLLHAPGGSRALAVARDGVFLDGAHSTAHWRVAANAWLTSDDAAGGDALRSIGGSFTPTWRMTSWLDVGVIAQSMLFTVVRASGAMGTGQEDLGSRATVTLGALHATGELLSSRTLQQATGLRAAASGDGMRRLISRTDVSYSTELGAVGLRTSFEAPTATQGGELMYELRVEGVRPFPAHGGLTFDAAVQRLEYAGKAVASVRAAAQVALPLQARLVFAAQQDQFLRLATGMARPVFSVKLERSFGVDVAGRLRETMGTVYEDVNANGRRDAGEAGVPGVVVQRGTAYAGTDARGRYRLRGGNGPLAIDARTLPSGSLASGGSGADLSVVPTRHLAVRVRLLGTELALSSLGPVTVVVRHADGREWMARADAEGTAYFDALPAGIYEVTGTADAAREPMLFEPVVGVHLDGGKAQSVELVAHPRPMRVFQQPRNDAGRARGPASDTPLAPTGR